MVKYIVNYMKENLSTYQVTVMAKSINALGSFSSSIVKIMIDEFSSIVVDSSLMDTIPANRSYGNLWDRTSDQSKLKIGIVEPETNSDTIEKLLDMLDFFKQYSEFLRGKCIILLINGKGQSLERFLRFAWSKDFLDLTVVEWIDDTSSKRTLGSSSYTDPEVFIHFFNPFEEKYTKKSLSEGIDLLPDKLKNLQGHQLSTAVLVSEEFVNPDKNHGDLNDFDEFQGEDIYRAKLLAETMNFSTILKFMVYKNWMSLEKSLELEGLQPDFFTTSFLTTPLIGNISRAEYMNRLNTVSGSTIYMSRLKGKRLYIIQQKVTLNHNSINFFLSCGSLITLLLIFTIFSRIIQLNGDVWSILEITRALMGRSMMANHRAKRLGEKIFLVTVYFTSMMLMITTLNELNKMNLNEREVLRFKTLKELADSKVSLRVTNSTKIHLSRWGQFNPVLREIAEQSVATESFDPLLISIPRNASSSWVYGGLDDMSIEKSPHVLTFDQIWFACEIEDDIESIEMIRVRENLPYKDNFKKVIQKSIEAGLSNAYLEKEMHYFMRSSWQIRSKSSTFYPHHNIKNDTDVEMPLEVRLIIIILIGYCLSFVVLAFEIVMGKLNSNSLSIPKSRMKRFENRNVRTNATEQNE
ncbi:hypothetical protein QAD02_010914 [Eretmocerus hayati]|uniref:Uncharacterized protein n=1 Tax=Eretmocerus hayati TaxID=131215 RepID=A0ACC2NV99_9HYME|nr:hypothetical protein QAD02_010914 [Eretmocerus hayati]